MSSTHILRPGYHPVSARLGLLDPARQHQSLHSELQGLCQAPSSGWGLFCSLPPLKSAHRLPRKGWALKLGG